VSKPISVCRLPRCGMARAFGGLLAVALAYCASVGTALPILRQTASDAAGLDQRQTILLDSDYVEVADMSVMSKSLGAFASGHYGVDTTVELEVGVSAARRLQNAGIAGATALSVVYHVNCNDNCDAVQGAMTAMAADPAAATAHATALIAAINQVAINNGFTSPVVVSTQTDIVASFQAPEQITITLPGPAPAPAPPAGPTLTISDGPYVAGDVIAVAFTGASSATDWVGLYVAGHVPGSDSSTDWVYHHGTTGGGDLTDSGSVDITPPAPGNYFIVLLGNDGYTEIATRIEILVTASPAPPPTLAVSGGPYTAGVDITVTFTGASSTTDWIGFYTAGSALDNYDQWVYHHGTQDGGGALVTAGAVTVTPPAAGDYFIAFLGNNAYVEIADRIAITVGAQATSCSVAIDLLTVDTSAGSQYDGNTNGNLNTEQTSCGGNGNEAIFTAVLQPGQAIDIGMDSNGYDSRHETKWGGACPGDNVVTCTDDPDTRRHSWTNDQTTAQPVFFTIDAYSSGSGDFHLSWSIGTPPPSSCDAVTSL